MTLIVIDEAYCINIVTLFVIMWLISLTHVSHLSHMQLDLFHFDQVCFIIVQWDDSGRFVVSIII